MFRKVDVKAAAGRHGKSVVGSVSPGRTCAHVFGPQQHLAKWCHAVPVPVRNPGTKKISGQRKVKAAVQNVAVMIAAEIGDAAQPLVDIVGNGSAAAVEIEILCSIPAIVGISGKDIYSRVILRLSLGRP